MIGFAIHFALNWVFHILQEAVAKKSDCLRPAYTTITPFKPQPVHDKP